MLRYKEVAFVLVLCRNQQLEEVIWEEEEAKKLKYPHLFKTDEKDQNIEWESLQISISLYVQHY